MTKTEMKRIARQLVLYYGDTADAYEETIRDFWDECRDLDGDEWWSLMTVYRTEWERVRKFLGVETEQ